MCQRFVGLETLDLLCGRASSAPLALECRNRDNSFLAAFRQDEFVENLATRLRDGKVTAGSCSRVTHFADLLGGVDANWSPRLLTGAKTSRHDRTRRWWSRPAARAAWILHPGVMKPHDFSARFAWIGAKRCMQHIIRLPRATH